MKTMRLALIATFIAFVSASSLNADGFKTPPSKKVINLTLEQAVQNQDLVIAMYYQLDPGFLGTNQQVYTVQVMFNNYIIRVTGTYQAWQLFFKAKPSWE